MKTLSALMTAGAKGCLAGALLIVTAVVPRSPAEVPVHAQTDPIQTLVARLDLEKYKATVKGLTQFGDRRQGTDRTRAAVDWIEAQLKSYGCPTERIKYVYEPPPPSPTAGRGSGGRGNTTVAQG